MRVACLLWVIVKDSILSLLIYFASMSIALAVHNVTKIFQKTNGKPLKAVDEVNLIIKPGQIYGLLGLNGAGKSTLINMISGILLPNSGDIRLFDFDVVRESEEAKKILGIVSQEIVMEPAFTVQEVLYYFSGMYGVPPGERSSRITKVLEDFHLSDKRYERARSLSGGMKRRLMIAKAILHRPKLLILDEPTAGVDVALRQRIWQVVRRLKEEGTTVLFTTHYLEEAEQLCEAITLIHNGKVIKEGNLATLQKEFSRNVIHFEVFDQNIRHLDGVRKIGNQYEYPVKDLAQDMAYVMKYYHANLKSIKNENASLEEIFLELTKPAQ